MNKDFLSDVEKEKVSSFVKDKTMLEAVKKVILYGVYENGTLKRDQSADPTKNFLLSLAFDPKYTNEELGADLRAAGQAIVMVEKGLGKLEMFVEGESIKSPIQPGVNPAE